MIDFFKELFNHIKVAFLFYFPIFIVAPIAGYRGGYKTGDTFSDALFSVVAFFFIVYLPIFWKWPVLSVIMLYGNPVTLIVHGNKGLLFNTDWINDFVQFGIGILIIVVSAKIIGLIIRPIGGLVDGIMGGIDEIGDSVYGAMTRPHVRDNSRARAKAKADKEAYDRWYAQDQAAKARWDARDDALRGKDIAARQDSARADYYDNQARK